MESWQKAWREGFARTIDIVGLKSLRKALLEDSPMLIQGATTSPPPLACVQDWPVEAACAVSYCGWQGGEGVSTVGDVEEYFARKCFETDQLLGEPAGCRFFLIWFDETPRSEMREKLLEEVERQISLQEEHESGGCGK